MNMHYILASDPLAPWGQVAAIILLIYMLVFIVIGLALALALYLGLSWVREKVELIKRLRPTVESVNTTTEAAIAGRLPAPGPHDNKVVRTVAEVPVYAHKVEEKVDQGSDRVAKAVIEFRARTLQGKQVLKAFFLPGLTQQVEPQPTLEEKGVAFKSPGYRILIEEKAPAEAATSPGEGYVGNVAASQLKGAPVQVVASPPKEVQSITSPKDVLTSSEDVPTH
jgi:hypothetical protein